MRTFVTRPRIVRAEKLTKDNVEELAIYCGGVVVQEKNPFDGQKNVGINVPTLRGNVRLSEGYYLIENDRGQFETDSALSFESRHIEQ